MIKYSAFNTTDDHSYNVYNAILYCIANNENGIIFDNGRYDFYYIDGDLIFFKSCTGVKRQEKFISSYVNVEEI